MLVIENPRIFYQFHIDLDSEIKGSDDQLSFSDYDKSLDFYKIGEWILSPWTITLSDRKTISKLYTHLSDVLAENDSDQEILRLWTEIESIIQDKIVDEPLVVVDNDVITMPEVLKVFNVKFDQIESNIILELLMDYMLIKAQYNFIKLFIFDQFLGFLTNEDLEALSEFCKRESLYVLLVESNVPKEFAKFPGRHVIIDMDLCDLIF